jgi:hypothetical protein
MPRLSAIPLKYGYSAVGRVRAAGQGVDAAWDRPPGVRLPATREPLQCLLPRSCSPCRMGLHPRAGSLLAQPGDCGQPGHGWQHPCSVSASAVLGQGIVGLAHYRPAGTFPARAPGHLRPLLPTAGSLPGSGRLRQPRSGWPKQRLNRRRSCSGGPALLLADLAIELSGAPEALDTAIALTGFAGRIVIGSWYGQKRAALDLGGRFHRSRIRLVSSQVSTIDPALSGRWDESAPLSPGMAPDKRRNKTRTIHHASPAALSRPKRRMPV